MMSKILPYKLTRIAESDLLQIKYYSEEVWGQDITKKYLTQIHNKCIEICNFPHIGINRPEIFESVKSIAINSHMILYALVDNKIEILRVLHKNMDITKIYSKKLT
ncbi:type II toxin-antitoxin system RelE/ParE family toxin [Rickettsia bellii]|uniref:Toxin n=1 Tax=Rickettsia bellii str. RML Mogi TaxID=1359194 RepID=A0A0F3QN72_RICBE|nr:type II toxin-antitoxin system RelE/ParE family toxin [Rickettsia bellii]KJV92914.1 plasmid stabilization system family protein [Rickettsia bellii str. RML Mogi]